MDPQQQQQQQYYFPHGQPAITGRPSPTGNWWSKLSLRILSIIFCIAVVGFAAYYYTGWTIGALLMMGPPAIVTLIWDVVDVLCLFCLQGGSGIHPNACLLVDGLLFVGLAAMSGVIAHTVTHLSDSGFYFAFFEDDDGTPYLRVVLGFGILAAALHLVLMIIACVDIKGRKSNKNSSAPQIIYVQGTPNGMRDQVPMEPWSESSPPAYSPAREGQSSMQPYDDQIRRSELQTGPVELPGKKVEYQGTGY